MKETNKKENPNVLANVRGIGVISKHGREHDLVADVKVHELADSLEKEYTKDEQYYILLDGPISGYNPRLQSHYLLFSECISSSFLR